MSRRRPPSRRSFLVGALASSVIVPTAVRSRSPPRTIDFSAEPSRDDSESDDPDDADGDEDCRDDDRQRVELFVAVVDRIVDGEHVVLLLEDGGELVDQHVEPVGSFEAVAESDILFVALEDDALLAYQHLEERPAIR